MGTKLISVKAKIPVDSESQERYLKRCPFCGSEACLNQKEVLKTWIVECSGLECPASYMIGNMYDTPEEAILAWNTRYDKDGNKLE